jgi:hypothetical protein
MAEEEDDSGSEKDCIEDDWTAYVPRAGLIRRMVR